MRIDKLMIAMMAFMIVMTTVFFALFGTSLAGDAEDAGGIVQRYDLDMNESRFADVYRNNSDLFGIGENQREAVLDEQIEAADSWENIVLGGYKALRFVKNSFTLLGKMSAAVAEELHIPNFWLSSWMIAILILTIFGIIYLTFRFKPRNN